MSNVVMPKNSALEPEIKAVLEIYSSQSAPGWMDSSEYIPLLKAKIGEGQYASSYPKKAQIPSYFGLVEWMDKDNNKSPRRITERGRAFFDAWEKEDFTLMHSLILEALETTSFGRDNSGSPSSRSDVQPPCLCIRLILDLGYVTTNEFAYVLWQIADKFNDYTESLNEIKKNRAGEISLDFSSLPNSYLDAKPITFLKNIRFLETSDKGLVLNPDVKSSYENRLKNLKIYVIDNNVTFPMNKKVAKYKTFFNSSLQLITYGAPGTGKSYKIKGETAGEKVFRTTFHPDSDYATFVGAYKPIMKDDGVALTEIWSVNGEKTILEARHDQRKGIAYSFVEQVFTKAYIEAWTNQKKTAAGKEPEKVYLVIEEINRGNCAQIFGDLFQLLDRNDSGFSDYPIKPDSDFGKFIAEKLSKVDGAFDATRKEEINALYPEIEDGVNVIDAVMNGELLLLPDNLYIRATMNTSDQSLFPMDSAFKRRWDWDYVAITNHKEEDWKIEIDAGTTYSWWDFLDAINKEIFKATSSEDKELGYFFVKAKDKKVDLNTFVNKVIFYLWNSIFKDCYTECEFLKQGTDKYFTFTSFFNDGKIDAAQVKAFLGQFKGLKKKDAESAEAEEASITEPTEVDNQENT